MAQAHVLEYLWYFWPLCAHFLRLAQDPMLPMLQGWRGLGSHLSVELHALWAEPFFVSRRSLRKKVVHNHSHLYFHHQMTNFSNFGEMVVNVNGGEAKTRPHKTLTNANFKVLYRNKLYFWQHWCSVVLVLYIFKASALWADAFYKSKCPYVCLSVCVSVHFLRYRLNVFLPPLPEVCWKSNIFRDSESLGKSNGKKWSQIWKS